VWADGNSFGVQFTVLNFLEYEYRDDEMQSDIKAFSQRIKPKSSKTYRGNAAKSCRNTHNYGLVKEI
jgi:hypothetical protein